VRTLVYSDISWHDDPGPTEKDLRSLQKKYHFHELDIDDCLSEHERPKIEEYERYLFLVFHIPYLDKKSGRIMKEEVNIFFGQNFIVTLHQGKLEPLDRIWRECKRSARKRDAYLGRGLGFFLYVLMLQLFEVGFPILDAITRDLRRIEHTLFESEEAADLLRDILTLKRNIITMRSILLPQRTLVAALEHKNERFIARDLEIYFDNILDAIERQWAILERAKELSEALHETHESWLGHKTNAIIRVLTIFSVTMLPLNFLTGLYGMNVALPFQEYPPVFLLLLFLMVLLLLGFLSYFAWKKWL
jgi:magnesium transporter